MVLETTIEQHLHHWLVFRWGSKLGPVLPHSTKLKEDLGLDDIAIEELFHYLDKNHNKLISSDSVVFSSQTVKDVLDFYSGNVVEPKTVLLFPGQGAQTVGMGKELLTHPKARELFEKAQKILGYDLLDICLNGPQEKLAKTVVSQVAIFVCSLASLAVVKSITPKFFDKCTCVAGLSLGEYTALVAAGAMDFESGLSLVMSRAEAMQSASDNTVGGMVSVLGVDEETVNKIISDVVSTTNGTLTVANYLCPGNIVVSGDVSLCDEVVQKATKPPYNAKTTRKLAVAGAFHSNFMLQAHDTLEKALKQTKFSVPNKTVMCNLTGTKYNFNSGAGINAEITHNLRKQLTSPVRWEQGIKELLEEGYTQFYEIGPGTVLVGLMRHILRANPQFENNIHVEKI